MPSERSTWENRELLEGIEGLSLVRETTDVYGSLRKLCRLRPADVLGLII
jgi:hypothetical protein